MDGHSARRQKVAVVGTGISGLAAAWLLHRHHDLTIYEQDDRIGGHTCTVEAHTTSGIVPVDMGFIVYNERTYPNLTAMFDYLDVPTSPTDMSLAISLDDGRLEYAGGRPMQLLAQKRNLLRPRFWSMLRDLTRFYRKAPCDLQRLADEEQTLGAYLEDNGYGQPFIEDHLLPMAAAIWSAPRRDILEFPAYAFISFQQNHGLLNLVDRPLWRTVSGGSREYVKRLTKGFTACIQQHTAVRAITRHGGSVTLTDSRGAQSSYDQVVVATHADQALRLLTDASLDERRLLGAFRYNSNTAYLHADTGQMPKRRQAWASWNYIGRSGECDPHPLVVTYWMNLLQSIPDTSPMFVTLNPETLPRPDLIHAIREFEHPVMDTAAVTAQKKLWSLQGHNRTWYCGAYFGAGFHEDGLQAGLAVAEELGGVRRPWQVVGQSDRIVIGPGAPRPGVREVVQ